LADIFDTVSASPASTSGGDIFDQVDSKPDTTDYAHPAGATAPLNAPAAHPAVSMQAPPDAPSVRDAAIGAVKAGTGIDNVETLARGAYSAGKDIVGGAKDIYSAASQDFEHSHGNPFAPSLTGDAAAQNRAMALGGAAKLIKGGGTAVMAVEAPSVLDVASQAFAGSAAAKIALGKILAGVATGSASSAGAGAIADKYNFTPEAKNLVQAVSFFLPSMVGLVAGVKTDIRPDLEGNPSASVSAFGGRVKAGATVSPENISVAGKVGDTRAGFQIPRGAPEPPPDPARVLETQQTDSGTNAIIRAATKAQQAAQVVAGGPPPPPPGPPLPDSMHDGVISAQTVNNIASAISIAPQEQHAPLLLEAHGKLTEYIQKQGRIIGPDGKLQIAETPQQAAKMAQGIINDEVDRHTQAKEDSQKQLEKQQSDLAAQKEKDAAEAQKPNADGVTPADQQFQRAKTIIEGTRPNPGQHLDETLERNLNIDKPTAHALIDRYSKEAGESQLPTVGSKKEPVVEESRATVDAQVGALQRGDINVVMLPEGSKYRPAVPDGMKIMGVKGAAPGAGLYLYNPKNIGAATIREAAKAGTHGDLLGHVTPKAELDPAKPTMVVQAQDEKGTPIQDSEVHPERIAQQVEAMQERHPEAHVVVKPTGQVIQERLTEHTKQETGQDIFDQLAEKPAEEVAPKSESKGEIAKNEVKEQDAGDRLQTGSPAPKSEKIKKGDKVTFKDLKDKERTGTVAHIGDRITRIKSEGKEYTVPAKKVAKASNEVEKVEAKPETKEIAPGSVGTMKTSDIHLDPKRFQYKLGVNSEGVSDLLTGKKWNDDLAGIVSVWRDPENGKTYVVNGHHRVTLAKQSGAKTLAVRTLKEPTAAAARAVGALQNIAEGRGTALDAAKFIRDSGVTLEDLDSKGISMGEATAQKGVALSRLSPNIFEQVATGKIAEGRAVAIGRETDDPAKQEGILKLIAKAEKSGKRINDGTVEELARFASSAGERTETNQSLFGDEKRTTSNVIEKAEVSAYVKNALRTEKRVFGSVSKEGTAQVLEKTGNKIETSKNADMATSAEQGLEVYAKLSTRRGPIDDILNRAAGEVADGKAGAKQQAYDDIRTELTKTIGGGEVSGADGVEGDSDRPPDRASLERAGQQGFFSPVEHVLPGLEDDVAKQEESAAEVKAEGEKKDVEASLTKTESVDKAAGDMERNSPLFRDSEANDQGGLFKGDTEYLHGGLGIAAGALKPLAQIKPVADAIAFLGDEADRVAVSRDLHNRLYDLASQDNAAVLRVVQMLKEMPGTAKDQQAIYHHLENPNLELSAEQQGILDDYLTPLIYHAEHDFQVITEGGVPLENYVHRQVRDKGGMIDRIMEKVKDKTPSNGIGGGRLTKTAPAQKHRTMMAIEDAKTGKRQVVSIKGGRVTLMKAGQPPQDIGGLHNGLTSVGAEVDERMAPFVKRVTELRDEIAGAKDADKVEQLADVQSRIVDLKKQLETLSGVTTKVDTKTPDLFQKGVHIRSSEVTFNQRAEITRKLEPLLKREEALKSGTAPMLSKNVSKLSRAKAELKGAEAFRDAALNELPPETFGDRAWKDKNGTLHKITQATTKEIEANTDVRYYQNAAGSVAVNYLAMDKARRAYDFLEDFKNSPEFAEAAHSIKTPGAIPKGWKATQLPQFRGYFFEPHVAEVLDAYAAKAVHDPGILEKVGNFMRASIFFNPLIHIPNLLNHWVVEKGVSGFANPLNYPTITRAGIKAMNAVIHQNKDFLEALDHGAPLQSQQFETKQFADLFFKRMQDELGDPESNQAKELAKALGMSPVGLVKAIYDFSGKATWYTNDIAFLQSTYEKQEKGMSLKDALTETGKHIPDYRLMTRIFDNPNLAKVMSNKNLTMFGAYHYGALKSYGQMAKSLTGFNWTDAGTTNDAGEPTNTAGRTEGEEKLHGLDTLAMMALVTFVAYPLIDKLWKTVTHNDKAQMRRAGASTLIYNLAMLAKGEKTPEEVAESVATPAVQTKAAAELVLNRDLRTGQRLFDPHAPAKKLASQVGRQLMRSIAPVSQGMDIAEGRTDWKRLMYSMVGVSFPLHGAQKIAAQITAENLSSLPPRDEDEIAHAIQRSRALHDAWSGDRSKLDELLHSKDFTSKEKAKIRKDVLLPPIVYAVRGMTYNDAMRVYEAATPQERHQLHPLMSKKLANLVKEGKKPETVLGKDDDN
jgi:hypothetical protein